MLPTEKRVEVIDAMQTAFHDHHDEILTALRPIVEANVRESLTIVEEDLKHSLASHRADFESLGGKYQREIVEKEIVPLVRNEIWPIVREHAEPEAEEVGREIWRRVSLWRFGWRYAYDKAALNDSTLVQKEWRRFVNAEAVPVLEEHMDEFVNIQQQILRDVARNETVRQTVRKNLGTIVEDPELQKLVWQIVRESMIDNPRLKESLRSRWKSDEARAVFQLAGERLEPTVRQIGELLFGTQDEGITPEFARVLRNQILVKDRQWLVWEPGTHANATSPQSPTAETMLVRMGGDPRQNPFVPSENGVAR